MTPLEVLAPQYGRPNAQRDNTIARCSSPVLPHLRRAKWHGYGSGLEALGRDWSGKEHSTSCAPLSDCRKPKEHFSRSLGISKSAMSPFRYLEMLTGNI